MIVKSANPDAVIVVGSGLAGLACALELAPRPVTLITKTPQLGGGSSMLAKGGIAAAIGPGDTSGHHAEDTLSAGAGLSDPEGALQLAEDSIENLQFLLDRGVEFDRAPGGQFQLAQEAAHRYPRIVHAGGDATGESIMESLIERVRCSDSINVLGDTLAQDLVVRDGNVHGIVVNARDQLWHYYQGAQVVIATGGIGMAWWHTTNPQEATGDGLAMAARAGAKLADLEFVQFHPTALAANSNNFGARLPLLTEALRGAGAVLLDSSGRRFMLAEHAAAELAPRDVVARAINKRTSVGQAVFLDMRPIFENSKGHLFPQALAAARDAGFEPAKIPVPIIPAAHYHMGGIETDHHGQTSINGLWACGEVATTGIHGANRLASNSLLEALVYGRRVALDIARRPIPAYQHSVSSPANPANLPDTAAGQFDDLVDETRKIMDHHVGVLRSGQGLATALLRLSELDRQMQTLRDQGTPCRSSSKRIIERWSEARNLLLVARLVAKAALQREESRGAHFRDDYPKPESDWKRRQYVTVDQLDAA